MSLGIDDVRQALAEKVNSGEVLATHEMGELSTQAGISPAVVNDMYISLLEEKASEIIWEHAKSYALVLNEQFPIDRIRNKVIPNKIQNEDMFLAGMKLIEKKQWIHYVTEDFYVTKEGINNL